MITAIIQNSEFIIMITIVGKMFNWKNQGLKHKSKSSMFKSQSSKDKKFKVQERFVGLEKFTVSV